MKKLKHNIKYFIIIILRIFIKPKNNIVLLSGFSGEYSDNTKYVAEKLHEKTPNIKLYWALGGKGTEPKDIPDYVNVLYNNTLKFLLIYNRARVLVDNYYGFFMSENPTKFFVKLKNKRQYNISTWHGTPLKCIGKDAKNTQIRGKVFSTTDLCIAGCEYTKEKLNSSYISHLINPVEIKLTGTPRNDALFETNKVMLEKVKNKLGLPLDKKVVLYAPTFRDDVNKSGVDQLKEIDVEKLLRSLKKIDNSEWIFVFRVHHEVMDAINKLNLLADLKDKVYNGNEHPDMAEYLCVTDCLITDYSGSLFDFALTKRPCFLYANDFYEYTNEERGLYMDITELPYSFSENFEELLENIYHYDDSVLQEQVDEFLNIIGNVEDGNASDRIVEIILDKLECKF